MAGLQNHHVRARQAPEVTTINTFEGTREDNTAIHKSTAEAQDGTCDCHRVDWCTCGTARIAKDQLQPATYGTKAFNMIYASKTKSGEVHELYRNLCTELNMDADKLEEAWRAYRAAKSKAVQGL